MAWSSLGHTQVTSPKKTLKYEDRVQDGPQKTVIRCCKEGIVGL